MAVFAFTALAASVTGALYVKFWRFKSWSRLGLATFNNSLPFGFANKLLFNWHTSVHQECASLYDEIKQRPSRHGGTYLFTTPVYVPIDPIIIKDILNSNSFTERDVFNNKTKDEMYNPLFYGKWEDIKDLKENIITKLHSEGCKSLLFQELFQVCEDFMKQINEEHHTSLVFPEIIEELNTKIVKTLFLDESISESELKQQLRLLSDPESKITTKYLLGLVSSSILKFLFMRVSNKKSINYFENKLSDSINERKATDTKSFFNLLIETSETNTDSLKTLLTLIIGDMKSIVSAVSFCVYELSCNKYIQNKLREEIKSVLIIDNDFSLDAISKMTYLDQVVKETLRKYPRLPILKRVNSKSYTIPSSTIHLKEDTNVIISISGLHNDADYFPEPEKFNPERFNEQNLDNIPECAYLPYGAGLRSCIGKEFAELQIKVMLLLMFSKFEISVSDTDDKSEFVANDCSSVTLQPNTVSLKITPIV